MGLMDTIKEKFGVAKGKADDMMRQHGGKADQGGDKTAGAAERKTGGKHSDKIGSAADKAQDAAHRRGGHGGEGQGMP